MPTFLTITAKGQVTLRKELLEHLGVGPGDKIVVDALPEGRVAIRSARVSGSIDDFIGSVEPGEHHLSIEEIDEIASRGWAHGR